MLLLLLPLLVITADMSYFTTVDAEDGDVE